MLPEAEIPAVLDVLPGTPTARTYARRVPLKSLLGAPDVLPGNPGELMMLRRPNFFFFTTSAYRFNPPGVRTLYVGEKESTVAGETKQEPGLAGFDSRPSAPHVVFHVEIAVVNLLDVTDTAVQNTLSTSPSELLAPWLPTSPNAPTQLLGRALHASNRFEGIRYQSAAMFKERRTEFCVVLFDDRLVSGSRVSVYDPSGTFAQQLWPRP